MSDVLERIRRTGLARAMAGLTEGVEAPLRQHTREDQPGVVSRVEEERFLPSGETSIDELRASQGQESVFGVSVYELRALSGVPDPFGPIRFTTEGLDNSELEAFRGVRDHHHDPHTRRAMMERVSSLPAVDEVNDTPRVFGRNHR